MEVLHETPKTSSFIPLAEHQSATPQSFYSGPPVLHYHSERCKVVVLEQDLLNSPALAALAAPNQYHGITNGSTTGRERANVEEGNGSHAVEKIIDNVDVWVSSDKFRLFSASSSTGVAIPYPLISLHAIQSSPIPSTTEQQALYMQIVSSPLDASGAEDDDESDSISITIIPTSSAQESPPPVSSEAQDTEANQLPAFAIFTALSNCSNLHPDPVDPADQDEADLQESTLFQAGMIAPGSVSGGLPPPIPGSGGWITAENMSEYFDEDGNWIGDEAAAETEDLGSGAGTVRPRNADGEEDDDIANGDGDETKWRRTG